MSMNLIEEVEKFVHNESHKRSSHYGSEPYYRHFLPVVDYAKMLQKKYGGDKEVVLISAWLHDIGSIMFGREDHHITGAKIAREFLKGKIADEKIKQIEKCILHHRGSVKSKLGSIEEQIVVEADALSTFDNLSGLMKAAFLYEKLEQKEANKSIRNKIENKWKQLKFPESKKKVREKYKALMLLLE
jgi:uncharacterized protein